MWVLLVSFATITTSLPLLLLLGDVEERDRQRVLSTRMGGCVVTTVTCLEGNKLKY